MRQENLADVYSVDPMFHAGHGGGVSNATRRRDDTRFVIKTIRPENNQLDIEKCRSEVHLLYSIASSHVMKPLELYEET